MTGSKYSLIIAFCLCIGLVIASCGGQATHEHNEEHLEQPQDKAYTAAYVCPMHCEGSGSDKPGTCPVCDMAYVENKDHGHDHDGHDHDGHDHDGHDH